MRFDDAFLSTYKGVVFQIRAEGISLSDRRVVKRLKLFAANAYLEGRQAADVSDLFVLKHIWNNEGQAPVLEAIVQPVLEACYHEHPGRKRVGAAGVGIEALSLEVDRLRQVLTGGGALSDIQLFSQLKALAEVKSALASMTDPRARELGVKTLKARHACSSIVRAVLAVLDHSTASVSDVAKIRGPLDELEEKATARAMARMKAAKSTV